MTVGRNKVMDKEAFTRQKQQDLDIDLMWNMSMKKMLRTTSGNLDLSHELLRGVVYELGNAEDRFEGEGTF